MLKITDIERRALTRFMIENQKEVTNMTAEQVYKRIKNTFFFSGMCTGEALLDLTNAINGEIKSLIKKVKRND